MNPHILRNATIIGIVSCLSSFTALGQEATPFIQRKVLLEVFSTERCNNCPAGHETLAYALGDKPGIIELVHHAGFTPDKFTIRESVDYEWFYKSAEYSGTFAPAFMMDRTHWDTLTDYYYYPNPMSMSFSSKALKAAYAEAYAAPALASVSISPDYNGEARLLALDVEAEALVATEGYEHPALNVFLTESDVFSNSQEGTFGSYYHQHLARKCLTTTWGEAFEAGGTISRHYEVEIPEDWNPQNMSVVAFVANYNPQSSADCRVMNAEEAPLDPTQGVIDAVEPLVVTATPPSPLLNLQGQRVNPAGARPGLYISQGNIRLIR